MRKVTKLLGKVSCLILCMLLFTTPVLAAYTAGFNVDSNGVKYTLCTYNVDAKLATNSTDTQYTGRSYSVTFNTNLTNSMSTKSSLKTSNNTTIGNVSTVSSYYISGNLVFKNWLLSNCDSSANNTNKSEGSTVRNLTVTNNKQITATAQWKPTTLYGVSGVNTTIEGLDTNLYSKNKTLGVNELSMNGYTFNGWKSSVKPNNVSLDETNYVSSIVISPDTTSAGVVLNANWSPNSYNVTYNFNFPDNATHGLGGKTGTSSTLSKTVEQSKTYTESYTMTFDANYTNIPIPTIKGWTFKGWYLDNGTSSSNYSNDTQVITATGSPKTVQTWGNHTLVAKWEQNSYNILFDRNTTASGTGLASGSMSAILNVKYDSPEFQLPANQFKKEHNVKFDATGGSGETAYILDSEANVLGTNTYKTVDKWNFVEWVWKPDATALGDSSVVPQSALNPTHVYTPRRTMVSEGVFNTSYITEINKFKYPIQDKAYVKNLTANTGVSVPLCATWEDTMTTLPNVKKEHNKFIGWYSKPQSTHGDTDNGAVFVGQPGDRVSINNDVTIYAWFNQNPTYTDIYEGTFYEGQDVSYVDLLKLIGVSDYEDDYRNEIDSAISTLLQNNPSNEEKTDAEADDVEIDDSGLPDISDTNEDGIDESLRAEINASVDATKLEVNITKVVYSQEWVDGKTWSDETHSTTMEDGSVEQTKSYEVDGDEIQNNGLDTRTENIGYFTVYYEVTDNGIWNGAEHILEENDYSISSPITLEYARKCQISYNNPPKLDIDDTLFVFTQDEDFPIDAEAELLKCIHESDAQDNVENAPWWSKKETSQDLYDSREILGIKDVSVNEGWANDNPTRAAEIRAFTSLDDIYGGTLSDEERSIITGYKVILDAVDQFGKHASNELTNKAQGKGVKVTNPDGIVDGELEDTDYQDEDDRTLQIVLINPDTDSGMIDANTYKTVRYISEKYLGTLGDSYWNEYGQECLKGSLKENATSREPEKQSATYQSGVHGNTVELQINDYSE